MMIEKQRSLNAIKRMNKEKKLGQLASHCPKLLGDGLMWNGVKSVYNVYLKHHPIKMGIQSGPNTMDHGLTTSFNHHLDFPGPIKLWKIIRNISINIFIIFLNEYIY